MNDDISELATRLRRGVARLNRRLRQSAGDGLSAPQVSMLATLEKYDGLALGELASIEQVRPPTITAMVKVLESSGLISRIRDDVDRRSSRVAITAAGREALAKDRLRRSEFLEERLAMMSSVDLEAARRVADFLDALWEME